MQEGCSRQAVRLVISLAEGIVETALAILGGGFVRRDPGDQGMGCMGGMHG